MSSCKQPSKTEFSMNSQPMLAVAAGGIEDVFKQGIRVIFSPTFEHMLLRGFRVVRQHAAAGTKRDQHISALALDQLSTALLGGKNETITGISVHGRKGTGKSTIVNAICRMEAPEMQNRDVLVAVEEATPAWVPDDALCTLQVARRWALWSACTGFQERLFQQHWDQTRNLASSSAMTTSNSSFTSSMDATTATSAPSAPSATSSSTSPPQSMESAAYLQMLTEIRELVNFSDDVAAEMARYAIYTVRAGIDAHTVSQAERIAYRQFTEPAGLDSMIMLHYLPQAKLPERLKDLIERALKRQWSDVVSDSSKLPGSQHMGPIYRSPAFRHLALGPMHETEMKDINASTLRYLNSIFQPKKSETSLLQRLLYALDCTTRSRLENGFNIPAAKFFWRSVNGSAPFLVARIDTSLSPAGDQPLIWAHRRSLSFDSAHSLLFNMNVLRLDTSELIEWNLHDSIERGEFSATLDRCQLYDDDVYKQLCTLAGIKAEPQFDVKTESETQSIVVTVHRVLFHLKMANKSPQKMLRLLREVPADGSSVVAYSQKSGWFERWSGTRTYRINVPGRYLVQKELVSAKIQEGILSIVLRMPEEDDQTVQL